MKGEPQVNDEDEDDQEFIAPLDSAENDPGFGPDDLNPPFESLATRLDPHPNRM